jgi:nucleoside-diphosphate kinase
VETGRNVIHGSDSLESAAREIALWFPEGVAEYEATALNKWIYE